MVQVKHRQRQQQSLQQETGLQHLLLQQRHHQIRKQVSLILQWLQVLLQRPQCSTIHYYHAFREYFLCRRFQQGFKPIKGAQLADLAGDAAQKDGNLIPQSVDLLNQIENSLNQLIVERDNFNLDEVRASLTRLQR